MWRGRNGSEMTGASRSVNYNLEYIEVSVPSILLIGSKTQPDLPTITTGERNYLFIETFQSDTTNLNIIGIAGHSHAYSSTSVTYSPVTTLGAACHM